MKESWVISHQSETQIVASCFKHDLINPVTFKLLNLSTFKISGSVILECMHFIIKDLSHLLPLSVGQPEVFSHFPPKHLLLIVSSSLITKG